MGRMPRGGALFTAPGSDWSRATKGSLAAAFFCAAALLREGRLAVFLAGPVAVSAGSAGFFFSALAIASSNQATFLLRLAFLWLCHSGAFSSPAISFSERLVRTE